MADRRFGDDGNFAIFSGRRSSIRGERSRTDRDSGRGASGGEPTGRSFRSHGDPEWQRVGPLDDTARSSPARGGFRRRRRRCGYEPLLRSWLSFTDQFLRGSTQIVDGAPDGPAKFDLDKAQAQGAIDLESGSPGCARGEVWLHNRGAGDLGSVRLRCSELLAHDGHVISSAAIEFEPGSCRCLAGPAVVSA